MTTTPYPYPTFPSKLLRPQWFVPHWTLWAKKDRMTLLCWSGLALIQLGSIGLLGGGWVNWVILAFALLIVLMSIQTANMNLDTRRIETEIEQIRARAFQTYTDPYLHHPYDAADPGNQHPDDDRLR